MKVCLDSRLIKKGEYFISVKGENFDGHKFIAQAMEKGAGGVIEEEELYKIASEKLAKIKPTVIAVTGSVGKSTMTEFIATLISSKHKVCIGNLNTKLGLAVNIVNDLQPEDKFFVAECGMDQSGELLHTGFFIKPDIAVLTNISESHMEKLGSLSAIIAAKLELIETLKSGGAVFLNWDCEVIRKASAKIKKEVKIYKYGYSSEHSKLDFSSEILTNAKLNIIGSHNYLNAIGACAVCDYLGIKNYKQSVPKLKTPKGRLKILEGINDSIIVDDTYNSSPVSLLYALEATRKYYDSLNDKGRLIAVLGGMRELGEYETEGHQLGGDEIVKSDFGIAILIGEAGEMYMNSELLKSSGVEIISVKDNEEAVKVLLNLNIKKGDVVLVKASQYYRLEKVIENIMKNPTLASKLLVRQDKRWKKS